MITEVIILDQILLLVLDIHFNIYLFNYNKEAVSQSEIVSFYVCSEIYGRILQALVKTININYNIHKSKIFLFALLANLSIILKIFIIIAIP